MTSLIEADFLCAFVGGIIVGICYAKANKHTKWRSKLGVLAIAGLIMMALGLFSAIHRVSDDVQLSQHLYIRRPAYVYTVGMDIKANGHVGLVWQWRQR